MQPNVFQEDAGQQSAQQQPQQLPAATTAIVSTSSSSSLPPSAAPAAAEMGRRRLPSLPSSAQPYHHLQQSSLLSSSSSSGPGIFTSGSILLDTASSSSAAAAPFAYSSQTAIDTPTSRKLPLQPPSLASILSRPSATSTAAVFTSSAAGSSAKAQLSSPIIYYSSYLPEKRDAAVNGQVPDLDQHAEETAAEGRVLFDPGLVQSAQSAALAAGRLPSWRQQQQQTAALTRTTMSSQLRSYGAAAAAETHKSAVLPGATFRHSAMPGSAGRVSPVTRPLSMTTSLSPPRRHQQQQQLRSQTVPAVERATHETLCQLRFKKELRETLARRRELLDTCEIEANHRQYVVDKWMRTGILPSNFMRSDSIPAVVKCSLSPELVAGARIVPALHQVRAAGLAYHGHPSSATSFVQQAAPIGRVGIVNTTTTAAAATIGTAAITRESATHQPAVHLMRSIGCQADGTDAASYFVTQRSWRQPSYLPSSTSLSAQLKSQPSSVALTRVPFVGSRDATTQTALCAETQTDPTVEIGEPSRDWHWPGGLAAAAADEHDYYQPWEDRQQQQQAQHLHWDQQQSLLLAEQQRHQQQQGRRRRGRLGRFLATSDTTGERSRKERLVREELEKRRRQLLGMQQPTAEHQQQPAPTTFLRQQQFPSAGISPHQLPPPFYPGGSLPRGMEFGGQQQPPYPAAVQLPVVGPYSLPSSVFPSPQMPRRTTGGYNNNNYSSSLPRDYERRLAAAALSPARSSMLMRAPQQQQFTNNNNDFIVGGGGPYSQSMQELDRLEGRFVSRFGGAIDSRWQPRTSDDALLLNYPYASRSVNYLDRMGRQLQQQDAAFQSAYQPPPISSRPAPPYYDDDGFEFGHPGRMEARHTQQQNDRDLMLSEYANYLNSQFLVEQQQRNMADRREQQQMLGQQRHFDSGLYDPGAAAAEAFQQQQRPPPMQFPAAPMSAYGYTPLPMEQPPGVYSRSEANYGARPPPRWTTDYGNPYWRSGQQQNALLGQGWPARDRDTFAAPIQTQEFPGWSSAYPAVARLAQHQRVMAPPPQSILRRRAPPLCSTTTGDEIWPREMDLSTRGGGNRRFGS